MLAFQPVPLHILVKSLCLRGQLDILVAPVLAGPACHIAALLHARNKTDDGGVSDTQKGFDLLLCGLSTPAAEV